MPWILSSRTSPVVPPSSKSDRGGVRVLPLVDVAVGSGTPLTAKPKSAPARCREARVIIEVGVKGDAGGAGSTRGDQRGRGGARGIGDAGRGPPRLCRGAPPFLLVAAVDGGGDVARASRHQRALRGLRPPGHGDGGGRRGGAPR